MSHKEHKVSPMFSLSIASLLMITTAKGKLRKYEYWSHLQCYLFSFSLNFLKLDLLTLCVFCLYVCIHTMHMPGAHRGQKKAMEPLELKLMISRVL